MDKSLVKKFFHVLGSSAVALSLGVSGVSAFGKDIILPGSGILLFVGLATTGIVTATVKSEKKRNSKTTLVNGTAVSKAHCCTPRSTDVNIGRCAKHCKKCLSEGKTVYFLSSDGWSYIKRCDKCVEESNSTTLQSLVDTLTEKYECSPHLVRCALVSVIAKDIEFCYDQLFEITKRADCVTSSGEKLECKEKIEKSNLLGWLAGFSSKSNNKSERAKELVMAIYNLDSKGFDDFYYEKVPTAKKAK